jgi:hypothetical protein
MVRKRKTKARRQSNRRSPPKPTRKAASRKPLRSRKAKESRKLTKTHRRQRRDPWLEVAVRQMNRGDSLAITARLVGIPTKTLRQQLQRGGFLKRKGNRWIVKDDRPRRIVIFTGGRARKITVAGFAEASFAAGHYHASGEFVRTNKLKVLKPFKGKTVKDLKGRLHTLETDPNALHQIASMDSPPFHEIYEITSNT